MIKTIRVEDDVYSDLIRIQGRLQLDSGRSITLEDVLRSLIKTSGSIS